MALYTRGSVERLKDAIDMVEIVGARTDLRRVGTRFTGLCPFHEERTPSFSVNAEHKLYHCFGCGASGDAIGFVRETEGLDFRGALELLADRYRVELEREREDPQEEERRRRRERLAALVERTAAFYARYLWDAAEARRARDHLLGRGLGEQVLRDFRVGYAPSAWHRVIDAAQRDGFREEEILAAGLAQRNRDGRLYDRFRGRIAFPLADARGRVLGFGARAVRDGQRPKYLNTSENELYHKGRQLFGIDRARGPAARAGRVVVVEGYTDVLALHQAGIVESVAIMGTALTPDQLAELARAATTVLLALDADRSGQEAMLRAARAAGERGLELRVVSLPDGRDPAELLAEEGAEGFGGRLDGALSVPEFEARRVLAAADVSTSRGRDRALEQLRPLIAATPERSATRDELVRHAADRLDLPPDYLTLQLSAPPPRGPVGGDAGGAARPGEAPGGRGGAGAGASGTRPAAPAAGSAERPGVAAGEGAFRAPGPAGAATDAVAGVERAFLAMCVGQPELGRELIARVGDRHLSSDTLRRVRDHLADHLEDPLAALPAEPAEAALVTDVAMRAEAEPSSEPSLRLSFLQLELRRVERDLRRAREGRDLEGMRALGAERMEVKRRIDEVMGQAV